MTDQHLTELHTIIANADKPVLVIVVAETCNEFKGQYATTIEEGVLKHSDMGLVSQCFVEQDMPFPRIHTPALYYFLPNNQTPIFWRGQDAIFRLEEDIATIRKMWKEGVSLDEARYTPEAKAAIVKTDEMLKSEDVSQFPSVFQMGRNFAKEVWNTGKRAATNQPVLVPATQAMERLDTCKGCDQFEPDTSRCKSCGCAMKIKTHLAASTCPLSKWKA